MSALDAAIPVWQVLAFLGAYLAGYLIWSWFRDQYEPAWTGRLPRFTRRWYATGAHIRQRGTATDSVLYRVLEWGDGGTAVPWLLVVAMAWTHAGADDPEPSWRPATDFTPFAVRRFHPVVAVRLLAIGKPVSPFMYETLPLSDLRAEDGS